MYRDQVLSRAVAAVMGARYFNPIRARACSGLDGEVIEIGFGAGPNVACYPPSVARVRAVDPDTVGWKLAARRVAASPVPVEYAGLDGQRLPAGDGSVDHVLVTFTLCTVPEPLLVLREARRVLRPGGALHFAEHGRAPDPCVARWQDRLTPLQRLLAGGCSLNRPIGDLVAGSGLEIVQLEAYYAGGPRAYSYLYEGLAVRPQAAGR